MTETTQRLIDLIGEGHENAISRTDLLSFFGGSDRQMRMAKDTELDVFTYRSGNASFMYVCECLNCHNKITPVMFPHNAARVWNERNTRN